MANIKPMQDKQVERIQCRLTLQEKNILQEKADARGKALGRYIVELGLADPLKVLPTALSNQDLADRLSMGVSIVSGIHQEVMDKEYSIGSSSAQIEAERIHLEANYRAAELLAVHDPDGLMWYAMEPQKKESTPPATYIHWTTTRPVPVNKPKLARNPLVLDYMLAVVNGEQPELTEEILARDPLLANLTQHR